MKENAHPENGRRYRISCLFPQADDLTAYAKTVGYTGAKRILVLDGKVISLRSINWFEFCAAIRARKSKNERKTYEPASLYITT
jgi:hypothetical protein